MENLNINEILAYYREELSIKRKKEIKKIVNENPDFKNFLKGLKEIEKELRDGETLENYLNIKKGELMTRIFPGSQ